MDVCMFWKTRQSFIFRRHKPSSIVHTQLNRPFQAPVWLAINPFINLYMTLKQKQVQIMPSLRTGQHRTDGGVCVCVVVRDFLSCRNQRIFSLSDDVSVFVKCFEPDLVLLDCC